MNKPSESNIPRNLLLGSLAALAVGCTGPSYYRPRSAMDRYMEGEFLTAREKNSGTISFSDLPKSPEDVYLLLFRNNPNDRRHDDDFLSDAAKTMGYDAPNYWHVEVAYFDQRSGRWMSMGCRPHECSADFPIERLKHEYSGYAVDVRQMNIPLNQQVQAREWFISNLQGRSYSLAGPSETNCSDAVIGLGQHGRIPGTESIMAYTRDQIARQPGTPELLRRYDLPSVGNLVKRDSIVFPDEFKKVGRSVGTMQF